jgi:hypothetical protein
MRGVLTALLMLAGAIGAQAQEGVPSVPAAAEPSDTLECKVNGYDLVFVNTGAEPIVTGSEISWSVRFARMEAKHLVEADIPPAGMLVLAGALNPNYLGTRVPCVVTLAPPPSP